MSLGGSLQIRPLARGFDAPVELRQSVIIVPNAQKKKSPSALEKERKAVKEKHKKCVAKANKGHWEEGTRCCVRSEALNDENQSCNEQYKPALVYRLRLYFANLSDSNQRAFYLERFRTTLDLEDTPDDEDQTNKKLGEIRVETPEVLDRRLARQSSGLYGKLLPNPSLNTACTQYMCGRFFFSMIQKSRNWAYPWTNPSNKKFYTSPGERSKSACVLTLNPGPKVYPQVTQEKTSSVLHWMKDQATLHCMLPNAEGTVLPYITKFAAHANYVLELEHAGSFAHAAASKELFQTRQLNADDYEPEQQERNLRRDAQNDVNDGENDDDLEDEDNGGNGRMVDEERPILKVNRKVSLFRYGNPLLGRKTEVAVSTDRSIASYSWFCKQWRGNSNPRSTGHPEAPVLKLRTWMPFAKCTECIENRKEQASEKDINVLRAIMEKQRNHIRFVKRERLSYRLRQLESLRSDEYISLIIDAADQSEHGIPHTFAKSHFTDAAWKLKLHLVGVIAHGYGAYVYTCPANFAQGHNITIQAILDTLEHIKKEKNLIKLPVIIVPL
jgi:hypothetical protein